MTRRCELTGKGVMSGNNVSHSNIKSRRRFLPNLQTTSLHSDLLGRPIRLRISTHALRSVEFRGGLDPFLLASRDGDLSLRARRFKRAVVKAHASANEA